MCIFQCIFYLCLRIWSMLLAVLLWELMLVFLIFCFLTVFQNQLNFISNPFSALSLLNSSDEILITIGKISPRWIISLSLNISSLNDIPSLHVINFLCNLVVFTDMILIVIKFWRKKYSNTIEFVWRCFQFKYWYLSPIPLSTTVNQELEYFYCLCSLSIMLALNMILWRYKTPVSPLHLSISKRIASEVERNFQIYCFYPDWYFGKKILTIKD